MGERGGGGPMTLLEAVEAWCHSIGLGNDVCARCGCEGRLRRGRCTDCLRELILSDLEDVA